MHVSNLTITVPEDLLRRARIRALEQGTSVNAVLREYLAAYGGAQESTRRAVGTILELSKRAGSRRGRKRWTRDDLHER